MDPKTESHSFGRALRWVRPEIEQALGRARQILAGVLDDESPLDTLSGAVDEMRAVAGVCQVARCAAAELLAEQLAETLTQVAEGAVSDREAVLGDAVAAMFRLGHYTEVVGNSAGDHPLALLDDINSLREGCGKSALKAPQVLVQLWTAQNLPTPPSGEAARSQTRVAAAAQRVTPVLRKALAVLSQDLTHAKAWAAWQQASAALAERVPGRFGPSLWLLTQRLAAQPSSLPRSTQAAVLELLKRQLALLIHAGKAADEALEQSAANTFAGWVLLLLRLGDSAGLAHQWLAPFGIDLDALSSQRLLDLQQRLKRPTEDSLQAVKQALRQDFAALKDEIDIWHAGGGEDGEAKSTIKATVSRLSASVRAIGSEELAAQLQLVLTRVDGLERTPSKDDQWQALAEELLAAEAALGSQQEIESETSTGISAELRSSILRECLINLTRLKTEVDALLADGDKEHGDAAVEQARQVAGALDVFGDQALTTPFRDLQTIMSRTDFDALMRNTSLVAAFADAVASAEYMLEALRDGDPDPGDEAERFATYVSILAEKVGKDSPAPVAEEATSEAPVSEVDDDLRDIFIEEAEEVLEELQKHGAQPDLATPEVCAEVRRAFHTLKGSGRMVGATDIGDFAWSVEHLLNKCIDGAREFSAPVSQLVHDAVEALPEVIDGFRNGRSALPVTAPLIARAEALLVSDEAEASLKEAPPAPLSKPESATEAATPSSDVAQSVSNDAELRLIFCSEAQDLLDDAERLLAALRGNSADTDSAHELQRVFHTLKGSARMADATGLADLGTTLDARAKHALGGARISDEDHKYFRAGVAIGWEMTDAFQTGRDDPPPDIDQRVETLSDEPGVTEAPSRPVEVGAEAQSTQPVAVDLEGVDQELLGIFMPECDELLDNIDHALADAQTKPSAEVLDAMFRGLHTLKGGARMCGLLVLGEQAHSLETEVENLRNSRRALGAEECANLQRAVDRLHTLRDAVAIPAIGGASTVETVDVGGEEADAKVNVEGTARVGVAQLDGMLSEIGEISMFRSRLEQQMLGMSGQLREFEQAIERLRVQVRNLEQATDAQIQARASGRTHHANDADRYAEEFDPLEMDRYTRMQELTRSITETIGDLGSLHRTLNEAVDASESMVIQQGRVSTQMQDGLLTTLAVPFARQQQRLGRVVRQVAEEEGKSAELKIEGGETELDRNVLERMIPAVEHILRNGVVHGIEKGEQRQEQAKPAAGQIGISLARDGNQVVVRITDDGAGLNFARIREEAISRQLLGSDVELSDDRLAQFIFEPGFSTASDVSISAGRGVGMDVVASELRQLGGSIEVASHPGQGSTFTLRLPVSLAVTQSLQVQVGSQDYIVPLTAISGVARVAVTELAAARQSGDEFRYGNNGYEVHLLGESLGEVAQLPETGYVPVLFLRVGGEDSSGRRMAVVVDHLLGTREVVAKSAGRQLAQVPGVAGATIQPDGRVVVILDVANVILDAERRALRGEVTKHSDEAQQSPLVLVIDDSITMRRVAERILRRAGYRVALAKDGADGVAQLQTTRPDAVLLDIEMPRMDGFEVASFIRHEESLADLPITMITSRSGQKHRDRARSLGIESYLIKPYQEAQLLTALQGHLSADEEVSA